MEMVGKSRSGRLHSNSDSDVKHDIEIPKSAELKKKQDQEEGVSSDVTKKGQQRIDGTNELHCDEKLSESDNRETSDSPASKDSQLIKEKFEEINDQLEALGFPQSEENGNCARAAIYNGFIKFTGKPSDLDQVILSDTLECGHKCDAKLGDLLRQPDWGGEDYDEGSEAATVICGVCDLNSDDEDFDYKYGTDRAYVTRICQGNPKFDYGRGKFHNHCSDCEIFGNCIGDYRNRHCKRCDDHYYAGAGGIFSCEDCGGSDSDESGGYYMKREDARKLPLVQAIMKQWQTNWGLGSYEDHTSDEESSEHEDRESTDSLTDKDSNN